MTNVLANLTTLELLSPNSFPVPSQQTTMFLGVGNPPILEMALHLDETKCYSTGSSGGPVLGIFADYSTGCDQIMKIGIVIQA